MSRTELHLHIPLDEREDLNDGAIQGELFANADSEEIERGYRGTVASRLRASHIVSSITGHASRLSNRPSRHRTDPAPVVCIPSRTW